MGIRIYSYVFIWLESMTILCVVINLIQLCNKKKINIYIYMYDNEFTKNIQTYTIPALLPYIIIII